MRLALLALATLACGGPSDPADAGVDSGSIAIDAGRGTDAGSIDAGRAPDAGGSIDAGSDIDSGSIDAGPVDLGPVACRDDGECGAGQTCDVDAPGGRCQFCDGTCVSSAFDCLFGACLRSCSDDGDCNAGMRCAPFMESTYCRPRDCADCPAPYVCRDAECSRPLCGASGCPSPLVCSDGVCVEP